MQHLDQCRFSINHVHYMQESPARCLISLIFGQTCQPEVWKCVCSQCTQLQNKSSCWKLFHLYLAKFIYLVFFSYTIDHNNISPMRQKGGSRFDKLVPIPLLFPPWTNSKDTTFQLISIVLVIISVNLVISSILLNLFLSSLL